MFTFLPNPAGVSLVEMLPRLQRRYAVAAIKKPFLSPEIISIRVDDWRLFVRAQPKRKRLVVDFAPPVVWMLVGMLGTVGIFSFVFSVVLGQPVVTVGGLLILLGFFMTKAIFKNKKKAEIAAFKEDVQRAMLPGEESSIF